MCVVVLGGELRSRVSGAYRGVVACVMFATLCGIKVVLNAGCRMRVLMGEWRMVGVERIEYKKSPLEGLIGIEFKVSHGILLYRSRLWV